jgi:hypothetical protein
MSSVLKQYQAWDTEDEAATASGAQAGAPAHAASVTSQPAVRTPGKSDVRLKGRCPSPWPLAEEQAQSHVALDAGLKSSQRALTVQNGPVMLQYPPVNGVPALKQRCANIEDAVEHFTLRRESGLYLDTVL